MVRGIDPDKLNLSFAGCGYLGIYHMGVASCFKLHAPHVLVNKAGGASVGALVATAMLCDVPLDVCTSGLLKAAIAGSKRALGPFHPGFDIMSIIKEGMDQILPEDAHVRCSGRLFISTTRVADKQNVLLSEFKTRGELLQALTCSCFIPFYCGLIPPKFHDVGYTDGGFSDNQPILDENTVTVAPFCGESDICPDDVSCSWVQISLSRTSISITPSNLYRFVRILFPGNPEMLTKLCQQGFDDALKFLQKNSMLSKTRYFAVQSSISFSGSAGIENHTKSTSCDHKSIDATTEGHVMPESVLKAIQDTCETLNGGLINQLFKYRIIRYLSYLSLPCILPVDIMLSCLSKMWKYYPIIREELVSSLKGLLFLVNQLVSKLSQHKHQYYKLSYHMAVREFDYTSSREEHTALNSSKDTQQKQGKDSNSNTTDQERVITNFKIDFTIDRPLEKPTDEDVMESLKGIEEDYETKAIEAARSALNSDCHATDAVGSPSCKVADCSTVELDQILKFTKKREALMTFYYMDENKRLNFTKIFNLIDSPSNQNELIRPDDCDWSNLEDDKIVVDEL